jgi:hypothetical protein
MEAHVKGNPSKPLRSAPLHRCAVLTMLAVLASAGAAQAADPIMPLSEVRAGMTCTGLSVVRGTPIEAILGARPRAATGARRAPRLLRAARPLTGPLTVSGLSPRTRRLLVRAAARLDRTVLAAPPGPLGGYPPQELVPGAAVSASLSTGDISVGAVGTVAYRDGDQLFAFGHALDGLGRRSLFLQDAYVFGVINNPLGVPDLGAMTYKLTSSGGHALGAITNDTFSAIAGSVGGGPSSIPLRATAALTGTAQRVTLDLRMADERRLGLGAGMGLLAPLSASTAVDRLLGSYEPVALTVCTRFRVRELRKPIGFCNPYFDSFTPLTDIAKAADLVDGFDLAPLHIRGAAVSLAVRRGFADDVIVGASGPRRVRAGSTVPVRVALRRRGDGARSLTVQVPIPAGIRPGSRTLVVEGNGFPDDDEGDLLIELVGGLTGEETAQASAADARTVGQLARRVASLRRPLGIVARFRHREPRVVLRSSDVRYAGRARVKLRVVPARR